jgi:hypothetical protein
MGNNQNPHVKKKKQNDRKYPVVDTEGSFTPRKSNTEALNEVKNQ